MKRAGIGPVIRLGQTKPTQFVALSHIDDDHVKGLLDFIDELCKQNEKGKPLTCPAEFYIDIDVCMNCGFCAEFCTFDSIVMDHEWKLADYEREKGHIFGMDKLMKPASYYQKIRPNDYAEYMAAKAAKEAAKAAKGKVES